VMYALPALPAVSLLFYFEIPPKHRLSSLAMFRLVEPRPAS
jgi:hypothetical protein